MFHLGILLWSVWFPFNYQHYKTNGRMKYIRIIIYLIGIFLPVLSIIATIADFDRSIRGSQNLSEGLGFTPFNFPPIFCTADSIDKAFYAMILPIDLILAVGGVLALLIIYGFYKVGPFFFSIIHVFTHFIMLCYQNNKLVGTAEKKLMLVLCYYMILTALAVVTITVILRNGEAMLDAIENYFLCELHGVNPSSPCRRDFEQYNSPGLLALTLSIIALYPLYVLIFVVNIRELKQFCKEIVLPNTLKLTSTTPI